MQIKDEILALLKRGKNLLAFSYGSDSSVLFYLLMQEKIDFDLVMINFKVTLKKKPEIFAMIFLKKFVLSKVMTILS